MPAEPLRDTIPRVRRVIDHARDQLIGLDEGRDRFDDCREQYGLTQKRLQREGRGRVTATQVPERDRNLAMTREILQELMRWRAVAKDKTPSETKFLDNYRDHRYEISAAGREMAERARTSRAAFTDAVTTAIIEAHPYFRALLEALDAGVIAYPSIGESDLARARADGRTLPQWAAWVNERIAGDPTTEGTVRELKRALDRFRNHVEKPSNKAIAEVMNDGFATAGFAARGLPFDANTIKTFLRWGSETLVYDQSRWVPAHPQTVVLWGCSDLSRNGGGQLVATRRGRSAYGERVARAITDAYRELADADPSKMQSPFIAVHRVRAQVAADVGVTRALVNRVLADLIDGEFPDISANAAVFVGSTTFLPDSEPAFRYHGGRRLVMQLTTTPTTIR